MPGFTYLPLNNARGEIRLINLRPGLFDNDNEVEIFHKPLSEHQVPNYEALSYAWGSRENPNTIRAADKAGLRNRLVNIWQHTMARTSRSSSDMSQVADRTPSSTQNLSVALHHLHRRNKKGTLSVTQNLLTALRHLRRHYRRRILWIDAICINKDDLQERSAEVGRMGLIFSKAAQTIVWLGPASKTSDLAMATLRSIAQDVTEYPELHYHEVAEGSQTAELEKDPEAMAAKAPEWKAIQDLLYRPWFTRLWIYQEISLSQQTLVVVGFSGIPWPAFRAALWWGINQLSCIPTLPAVFDVEYFDTHIQGVLLISVHKGFASIVNTMDQTKSAKCSDPRDRVYGILNMHTNNLGLTPDYSKTKEEVYEECTRAHVSSSGILDTLVLCEIQNSSPALPSWVPDLSVFKHTSIFASTWPSGVSRHGGHFSVSEKALHVTGVRADIISLLGESVPNRATLSEILAICGTWEPLNVLSIAYTGGGTMIDAFAKTLVCGRLKEDRPPDAGDVPTLKEIRRAFSSFLQNGQVDSRDTIHAYWMQDLRGRRFGTGRQGYIGAFPAATEIGDQIYVILGSVVPLLLRPVPDREGHFRLVGQCYIAGLMEGEALLGPLPESWKFGKVNKNHKRVYMYEGRESTLEDPRLGPLLLEWQICYEGGKERGKDGNLCDRWFENIGSDEITWADPRLTKDALIERGMDMKEFILI